MFENSKRALLIMPNFFDYPSVITSELHKLGYEVDFFDDRPSTNAFVKAIIRIKKDIVKHYIASYFEKILNTVKKTKYELVFLISGQSLSLDEKMIEHIKDTQPQAKFILYQWDSLKNFPYIERMQKYFDKCFSFDKRDVERIDSLNFLPLFYSERYKKIGELNKTDYVFDFSFVGTAHPKKYKFIKMMSKQLQSVYPNQYIFFYFPSRIVFFYRKLRNPELRQAKYNEFHYTPLNGKDMDDIICNSRCILDSAQDGQMGLTIRVLEALGAKKKLITTNSDVKNYDFYCEENIYIYDGTIDYEHAFFTQEYKEVKPEIYFKYSVENWLKQMLG